MTKRIVTALAALLMTAATAKAQEVSFQLVMDSSIAVRDEKLATETQKLLLTVMMKQEKAGYPDADIALIHTSLGRTVWFGTPAKLNSNGGAKAAMHEIRFQDGACNDLVRSFEELNYNIANSQAEEIYVVIFSSLVDTGRPCAAGVDPFVPMPSAIDAKAILSDPRVRGVYILGATSHQKHEWYTTFAKAVDEVTDGERQVLFDTRVAIETNDYIQTRWQEWPQ